MAVPCYILKASSPSFPLHTKCSGKRKKKQQKATGSHLGKKSQRGRCLLPAPASRRPLQKQSSGEQSTRRSGWRCGKREPDKGGWETGELSAMASCSSSTSAQGFKPGRKGAVPAGGLSHRRTGSFCSVLKGLLWCGKLGWAEAHSGHPVFHETVKSWRAQPAVSQGFGLEGL